MAVPPSPCESCQPSAPRVYQIFVRSFPSAPPPAPPRAGAPAPHPMCAPPIFTQDSHTSQDTAVYPAKP